MNILFIGGGSVGHIAPSVAVWEQCQKLREDLTAHFVCSPRKDDSAFLKANNLEHTIFDAPRLSLTFPIRFLSALKEAKKILREKNPDVVFAKGGYVSVPLAIAAYKKKIPIVMHESDSVSGHANRIVSKFATHICTGFPSQHSFTGNPIRLSITEGSKEKALEITGFEGGKPVLLVMGGSQGAEPINEAIGKQLGDLLLRCDIIHITGRGKDSQVPKFPSSQAHYYQTDFANDSLKHFYAAADIALSRAGAGSIAELAANSIPTILVPLRGVGHDHQYKNATTLAKKNACIHLEQTELNEKLTQIVHQLITDEAMCESLKTNFATFSKPDAALQIAKIVLGCLDSEARHQ